MLIMLNMVKISFAVLFPPWLQPQLMIFYALDNNSITYKSKEGNVLITNNDNEIANKLLNVMLNSLKELAKDYPKNIEIGG
jgi:uncharacterized protein YsxB (DUF464 family)